MTLTDLPAAKHTVLYVSCVLRPCPGVCQLGSSYSYFCSLVELLHTRGHFVEWYGPHSAVPGCCRHPSLCTMHERALQASPVICCMPDAMELRPAWHDAIRSVDLINLIISTGLPQCCVTKEPFVNAMPCSASCSITLPDPWVEYLSKKTKIALAGWQPVTINQPNTAR